MNISMKQEEKQAIAFLGEIASLTGYDSFVGRHAMELWNEIVKDSKYKLYNDTYKPNKRFELLVHNNGMPIMVAKYETKEFANSVAKAALEHGLQTVGRVVSDEKSV